MPRVLAPGTAAGRLVVLTEPLSLWGGMDPQTGKVIDARHPQYLTSLGGAVVAMPSGRGSSSSSSVLAEAIRAGTAPAGFILAEPDPILVLGSLVAAELYGVRCPVVALDPRDHARLAGATGARQVTVRIDTSAAELVVIEEAHGR
jgi:uncharacterized protein